MESITLRTSTGMPKGTVEVVGKVHAGYRGTHNHDARYLYILALGTDGTVYETKSSGGYRVARDQSRARARYHAVHLAQGAHYQTTSAKGATAPADVLPPDPELWHGSTAPPGIRDGMPDYAVNSAQGADD